MSHTEIRVGGLVLWVGITGSIGTGKSTFSNLLRKKGHFVLDADVLAKQNLEKTSPAFAKIVAEFGRSILDANGNIDRGILAKIVFSDRQKLEKLESISHPEVQLVVEKSKDEHRKNNKKYLFYDVPLLFEKNMEKSFDLVVLVTCTVENQIKRIKARNNWSDEEIQKRLAAQLPLSEKESKAHVLISNNGDLSQLSLEVDRFIAWLKSTQNQD
tara:strand:- start:43837 stop:44478 length:642 start_codon:yes stop_codon:yes gene_type:complete